MVDNHSPRIRFEVLGPLKVWRNGIAVTLGPVQQRVVLAVLLLHTNRPIGREQLLDAVWGPAHPTHAVNLLQRHVSGLRRVLEPDRVARSASDWVAWTEAGYLFRVPPEQLDLTRFDTHLNAGRAARAAGDPHRASQELHAALRLWRGPVAEGLISPLLEMQRERLAERYISALEDRIELDLELANHHDVIAELRTLVAGHPLRERLRELLMLALYRAGRQADALAAYQDARRHLLAEIGVAPAASLQRLHQQILSADSSLTTTHPALAEATLVAPVTLGTAGQTPPAAPDRPDGGPAGPPIDSCGKSAYAVDPADPGRPSTNVSPGSQRPPAQLPHQLALFVGREAELARLDRLLADHADDSAPSLIVAFIGMAGSGKTALALHWAHQARSRFPDGQLYLDLHGFDAVRPPLSPAEAARSLLEGLGDDARVLPAGLDALSARLRTRTAGRRLLMVLDNARDTEQLRPLLPGAVGCLVLATSRNTLSGLVTAEGAVQVHVPPLPRSAARGLLERRLTPDGASLNAAALDEIVAHCGMLPMALAVVAARAGRGLSLSALAEELRLSQPRLAALEGGDRFTSVSGALSWSYRALSPSAARLFRLVSLVPDDNFRVPVIAELGQARRAEVLGGLSELASQSLILERAPGRFAMHPLVREFAVALRDHEDEPAVIAPGASPDRLRTATDRSVSSSS